MDTTIEGYLVKLGFQTDAAGFSKFQGTFRDAQHLVEANVGGITKNLLEMQATIVGTFAAAGVAVLGLADKVAQADLGFQLYGMQMYLATNQAKSLKIASDALGHSLGEITWNPELRERFDQLVQDQNKLQQGLGGDFEEQMKKIRDIRFEFTRLKVEGEYLGMSFVTNLMKALGTSPDEILAKLQKLNAWIIENMPAISQTLVTRFLPVWNDIKTVMGDVWTAAKAVGLAFTNVVGAISGDKSIEGTTFSFDKLGGAIQHVAHWMAVFAESITDAISLTAHLISAIALFEQGNRTGALTELKAAGDDFRAGSGAVLGGIGGSAGGAMLGGFLGAAGGPLGILAGSSIGGFLGAGVGAGIGGSLGYWNHSTNNPNGDWWSAVQHLDTKSEIANIAARAGLDPRAALAVAQMESGFRQFNPSGGVLMPPDPKSHAMGIFQLQPSTARQLGVDPKDKFQNIVGGVAYLSELMNKSGGNERSALERYYGSNDAAANEAYANRVMQIQSGIQIGTLSIVTPSGNPPDIRRAVTDGIEDYQGKLVQRNLKEFQSMGWSYY